MTEQMEHETVSLKQEIYDAQCKQQSLHAEQNEDMRVRLF